VPGDVVLACTEFACSSFPDADSSLQISG